MESGENIKTLKGHTDTVRSVKFSPDGKILASGSYDNNIILWDVATRKEQIKTLKSHKNSVHSVCFSKTGRILASGSWDKTIKLWNVKSGE